MFGLFNKKKKVTFNYESLGADMHSHILPGIDDGAANLEDAVSLVKHFADLGFKKLIATPHIMADYFRNTPDTINKALATLQEELNRQQINIPVEAAAEYYLDETFEKKLNSKDVMLMGKDYILFELSYVNYPQNLPDIIKQINDKGYKPILAHPERYTYLHGSIENYHQIKDYGCYFQVNTISLNGYYGKYIQKTANELVENQLIDFMGSDMHHLKHADALKESLTTDAVKTLLFDTPIQNEMLI